MVVVVLDLLRVAVVDVCDVQLLYSCRALVKLGSAAVFQDLVTRYNRRMFPVPGDGGTVTVSDCNGSTTYVAVHRIPFEFPEGLLRRYFGTRGGCCERVDERRLVWQMVECFE